MHSSCNTMWYIMESSNKAKHSMLAWAAPAAKHFEQAQCACHCIKSRMLWSCNCWDLQSSHCAVCMHQSWNTHCKVCTGGPQLQVALAGFMPSLTYAAALLFTLSAVGITLWHFSAQSQSQSKDRLSVWNLWQLGSGLVGLAVVPQVRGRINAFCEYS